MSKDNYTSIRLDKITVERIKPFFKKIGRTYSDSLDIILDFFERTGYDPRDTEIGKKGFNNLAQTEKKITNKQERIIKILNKFEQQYFASSNAQLNLLLQEKVTGKPEPTSTQSVQKITQKPPQETTGKSVSLARYKSLENDLRLQKEALENAKKKQVEELRYYGKNLLELLNKIEVTGSFMSSKGYRIKLEEFEYEDYKKSAKRLINEH